MNDAGTILGTVVCIQTYFSFTWFDKKNILSEWNYISVFTYFLISCLLFVKGRQPIFLWINKAVLCSKKKEKKKKHVTNSHAILLVSVVQFSLGYYLTPSHWRKLGINVCEMYRTQVFTWLIVHSSSFWSTSYTGIYMTHSI